MVKSIGCLFVLLLGYFAATAADLKTFAAGSCDLSSAYKIPWVIIASPDYLAPRQRYHLLSPTVGFAALGPLGDKICRWDGQKWTLLLQIKSGHSGPLFALSKDEMWFTVDDNIPYRKKLLRYKNGVITTLKSPNSDGIRSLYFKSPDYGWAGCEWGQMLLWNGVEWKLTPSPTQYHLETIFSSDDSIFYARSDIPANEACEYFEFSGNRWSLLAKMPTLLGSAGPPMMLTPDKILQFRNDSLFVWNELRWSFVDADLIPADSLLLPFAANLHAVVWASHLGPVSSDNGLYLLNQQKCSPHDIIAIMALPYAALRASTTEQIFGLFSQTGLEWRLLVKSKATIAKKPAYLFENSKMPSSAEESGICIHDLNNDGKTDVYAVVSGGADRLYTWDIESNRVSSLDEIAEKAGLVGDKFSKEGRINFDYAPSCADIDNDGDQDLLITSLYDGNLLFRQYKSGRFERHTDVSRVQGDKCRSYLGLWADTNNDSFVDLFVLNSDSSSSLYLNNGAGIFQPAADECGLGALRASMAAFADIDGDNDLDLLLRRSGRRSRLFRNELVTGRPSSLYFREIAEPFAFANEDTLCRKSTCFFADFDNDGDADLFMGNVMVSNRLYENDGAGRFADATDQSGLATEETFCHNADFFDADNDGDLDILAANIGHLVFYENQGRLRFRIRDAIAITESKSGGLATGDIEDDGDIDAYASDQPDHSRVLKNDTNNDNFIQLLLIGTKSNRDAIGARVFFYKNKHAGEDPCLLGMRMVHGGYGAYNMSSRLIHFGVSDGAPKDIVIHYPSGIIQTLHAVAPGRRYTVNEQAGTAERLAFLRQWFFRTVNYLPLRRDAGFVFLMICSFWLALLIGADKLARHRRMIFFVFILPTFLFLLFFLLLHQSSLFFHYVAPAALGISAWILGFLVSRDFLQRDLLTAEKEEQLYFAASAFFHGDWGASKLNRLALFAANYDDEAAGDPKVRAVFAQNIADFFLFLVPEIEKILNLAAGLPPLKDVQLFARRNFKDLVGELNKVKVDLELAATIPAGQLTSLHERITTLRLNIRQIRQQMADQFATPVVPVLKSIVSAENGLVALHVECGNDVLARIRPSEFSQIMENLAANAKLAVHEAAVKNIRFTCTANLDRVLITVCDSGPGVPPAVREKLFHQRFTTKKGDGGFGLYHAAKILAKYGGAISLKDQQANAGAEFIVELKRINHE